ncbi:MAG: restriction endonuclease subunit S [Bacteroidaceae bacterium]|nr:restriction endonuclease subunit S [Bacteroidaceae bacterium]
MNKIDEMIRELCPEGVKRVKLGEVCEVSDYVSNGSFATLKANVKYLSEPNYAVLLRFADYSNNFDASKFVYIDEHAYNFLNKSKLFGGEIIISNVGSCGLLFRCPKLNTKMSLAPNTIMVKSKYQDYLYYWLKSKSGQESMLRFVSPGAMPKFNKTQFKTIEIPLPPLAIQQEIVSILDSFSSLQSKLEEELSVRQKQMEFYREKLLTFDKDDNSVKWMKLGEIGSFYNGVTGKNKEDFVDGNAKFITYMNIFTNPKLKINVDDRIRIAEGEKQNLIKYGDVLFTTSSETLDECGMSSVLTERTEENLYLNSFCFGYRFNNLSLIEPSFCAYLFRTDSIRREIAKTANGVTRFNVSKKLFEKLIIPVPSLSRQQEIVSTLDTMSSLIDKLKEEIELRKKQYEYYREALLSF